MDGSFWAGFTLGAMLSVIAAGIGDWVARWFDRRDEDEDFQGPDKRLVECMAEWGQSTREMTDRIRAASQKEVDERFDAERASAQMDGIAGAYSPGKPTFANYWMPGGWTSEQRAQLEKRQRKQIKDFLKSHTWEPQVTPLEKEQLDAEHERDKAVLEELRKR